MATTLRLATSAAVIRVFFTGRVPLTFFMGRERYVS
jgi:hypothetical protein